MLLKQVHAIAAPILLIACTPSPPAGSAPPDDAAALAAYRTGLSEAAAFHAGRPLVSPSDSIVPVKALAEDTAHVVAFLQEKGDAAILSRNAGQVQRVSVKACEWQRVSADEVEEDARAAIADVAAAYRCRLTVVYPPILSGREPYGEAIGYFYRVGPTLRYAGVASPHFRYRAPTS